ncbi:MAG: 23S rRNA (uracil(1939)-C(5))-methyltransferase RlmD [Gammaproteobacteria bacterium]
MASPPSIQRSATISTTTGRVGDLSSDGRGSVRLNGKAVFIEEALPGEDVDFQIVIRHREYDEARIRHIHAMSAERVLPMCEHYGVCGGCVLQYLSPAAQLAAKQKSLLVNLKRIGRVMPQAILPPVIGSVWGYRRRARLSVRRTHSHAGVNVGFVEKHSKHIADIRRCETLHPKIGHIIKPVAALIGTLSISDRIPKIEVAVCEKATVLVLRILAPPDLSDKKILSEFEQIHDVHFYLQPGDEASAYPLSGERIRLSYSFSQWGLQVNFEPSDFIQVNVEINQQLVWRALDELHIEPGQRVLDLFCGLGNFTLPLAKIAGEVVGVEGVNGSIARARANAIFNDLTNLHFYQGDLFKDQSQAVWMQQAFDRLLLDPPRAGAREILTCMGSKLPPRIVYISCHPATLARDANYLVNERKYRLLSIGLVDMFLHTAHVESMAVFARDGSKK